MKYEKTPQFDRDLRRLTAAERRMFAEVVRTKFVPACDRRASDPMEPWPASLRINPLNSRPDVYELTWEIHDGRATFSLVIVDGEPRVRWRRVGGHSVFDSP